MHAPSDEAPLRISLDAGEGGLTSATVVHVGFGHTRTRFVRFKLNAITTGGQVQTSGTLDACAPGETSFAIQLDRPLLEKRVEIEVHYQGERPCFHTATKVQTVPQTIEELFRAREAAIVGHAEIPARFPAAGMSYRKKAMFFCDLDRATMPAMLARQSGRSADLIQGLGEHLCCRTRERAEFATAGLCMQRDTALDAAQVDGALLAHELMKPVFDAVAPDQDRLQKIAVPSTLHRLAVEDCFESFVDGELALDMSWGDATNTREPVPGAPDGLFFLSFTEFVLYLHDVSNTAVGERLVPATSYWVGFLPLFARCAEAYVQLYWSGGMRDAGAYRNSNRRGALGEARWLELRSAYLAHAGSKRLERTFSALCAHALRDQNPEPRKDLLVLGYSSDQRV